MAFEDGYGQVSSVSSVLGYYDAVNERYVRPLLQLLPPGPIWEYESGDDMYELIRAMSYPFVRVAERVQDLLEEYDPRTTTELLSDWERVLDLPGDNPNPATTVAGRRAAVHALLLGHGDPTLGFYEGVAEGLGYDATVVHKQYNPFVPGYRAGDPLTNHEWAFVWNLLGMSDGAGDTLLKWTVEQTVPEHTALFYTLLDWTSPTISFAGEAIHTMAWGNGPSSAVFVVGGSNGKISSSTDGQKWFARTSNFGADAVKQIIWSEDLDLFIAVGDNGKISTSPDGVTWTARTSNFGGDDIHRVAWDPTIGSGIAVAVGANGKLSSSPDAVTWTAQTSQFGASDIQRIFSNNALFIATGNDGKISTSTNGTAWTARTSGVANTITDVAWRRPDNRWGSATERFVVVDSTSLKIIVSDNGSTWVTREPPSGVTTLQSPIWEANYFWAGATVGGAQGIIYSEDGNDWIALDYGNLGSNFNYLVKAFGLIYAYNNAVLSFAAEPLHWSIQTGVVSALPNDAGFVGDNTSGLMFAGGASEEFVTAFIATNEAAVGHHFTKPTPADPTTDLFAIAVDDAGLFCAVGTGATTPYIATSPDGETWTRITGNPGGNYPLYAIGFDAVNRIWVAVGSSTATDSLIVTSSNTLIWTERSAPKNVVLNAIAYGNSRWIAVGASDGVDTHMLKSDDNGATWSEVATPSTAAMYGIATDGAGVWITVGATGNTYRSIDNGATWSTVASGVVRTLRAIIYDAVEDAFVVVGGDVSPLASVVLMSFNKGQTWVSRTGTWIVDGNLNTVVKTEADEYFAAGDANTFAIGSHGGTDWDLRRYDRRAKTYGSAYYNNKLVVVCDSSPDNQTIHVSKKETT